MPWQWRKFRPLVKFAGPLLPQAGSCLSAWNGPLQMQTGGIWPKYGTGLFVPIDHVDQNVWGLIMFERLPGLIRGLACFVALSVVAAGLEAVAQDAPSKKLVEKAGQNAAMRQKLIAAGVLDASSDVVPSNHIKTAMQLFMKVYFDSVPDDSAFENRLNEISDAFVQAVGLEDAQPHRLVENRIARIDLAGDDLRLHSGGLLGCN